MAWRIASGPREFMQLESFDMDIGWGYTLERDTETRTVSVLVAGRRLQSTDLPEDSLEAIRTRGRSAIKDVLHEDAPPRYLLVTSTGVHRRDE